jgi:uncharacterized OB-fold protein
MELSYPLWSDAPQPALLVSRNRKTRGLVFPVVPDASPLAVDHETIAVDGLGEVYSFTVIHPGKKSGEEPYALGFVDFPGPVRIFGRLNGEARPTIGAKYSARRDERFGYTFEAVKA